MDLEWTYVGFGGVLALLISLYFMTQFGVLGLIFSLIVVGVLGFVLYETGILRVKKDVNGGNGLEIDLNIALDASSVASAPQPAATGSSLVGGDSANEVFLVANNKFTYDQAPAVCSAYGADLASYDQVEDAYNRGGEWCGYGWTDGGMALYPTQKSTWEKQHAQDPKHTCGRPGINGGYFNPTTKFGVNCYGKKPSASQAELDLLYAKVHKPADKKLARMVQQVKDEMQTLRLGPFNTQAWSEFGAPLPSAVQADRVAAVKPFSLGLAASPPTPSSSAMPNTTKAVKAYAGKLQGFLGNIGSQMGLSL